MAERTLGWVQDSCKLDNLKRVVCLFVPGSDINRELAERKIPRLVPTDLGRDKMIFHLNQQHISIPYTLLKGKGTVGGTTRATAPCSGIVQAALPGQSREYQSDWPADNFIRWAIAVGFLSFDREADTCELTESGLIFAKSDDGSAEEREVLTTALLSSPPVCRVLSLLDEAGSSALTKFELGKSLGFVGEAGFTSYPQDIIIEAISFNPNEARKLLADTEGSSDKYARTICSWLSSMGWVVQSPKTVTIHSSGQQLSQRFGQAWKITVRGKQALNRARGSSRYRRIPKRVPWEMLATKAKDREYLRNRRAFILQEIARPRTEEQILARLESEGFESESVASVLDDIEGLKSIGLNISHDRSRSTYVLTDEIIDLNIPYESRSETRATDRVTAIKNSVRPQLKHINHKYLVLIDLSFDGSSNREFEFLTADFFTKELGFGGKRLGDSKKPDVAVFHESDGLIIDNKAYSRGYNIPISQADEMVRYLSENDVRDPRVNPTRWWEIFPDSIVHFYFFFITSYFAGQWEAQIESIIQRTGVLGSGVTSEDLLLCGEQLKARELTAQEFLEKMLVVSRA